MSSSTRSPGPKRRGSRLRAHVRSASGMGQDLSTVMRRPARGTVPAKPVRIVAKRLERGYLLEQVSGAQAAPRKREVCSNPERDALHASFDDLQRRHLAQAEELDALRACSEASSLAQGAAREARDLADDYEVIVTALVQRQWPTELRLKQRLIAVLTKQGLDLPDDLHEAALRQALGDEPANFQLTYSLVALLLRLERLPMPEIHEASDDADAPPESAAIAELHSSIRKFADVGDMVGSLAALWRFVTRYPRRPLGWAEFARFFVDRGYLAWGVAALERAVEAPDAPTQGEYDGILYAGCRLIESGAARATQFAKLLDAESEARGLVGRRAAELMRLSGRTADALRLARSGLERGDADGEQHFIAFKALFSDGQLESAYGELLHALRLAPT